MSEVQVEVAHDHRWVMPKRAYGKLDDCDDPMMVERNGRFVCRCGAEEVRRVRQMKGVMGRPRTDMRPT